MTNTTTTTVRLTTEKLGLTLAEAVALYATGFTSAASWLRGFAFGASTIQGAWSLRTAERIFEGPDREFNAGVNFAWSLGPDTFNAAVNDTVAVIEDFAGSDDPYLRARCQSLLQVARAWQTGIIRYANKDRT